MRVELPCKDQTSFTLSFLTRGGSFGATAAPLVDFLQTRPRELIVTRFPLSQSDDVAETLRFGFFFFRCFFC